MKGEALALGGAAAAALLGAGVLAARARRAGGARALAARAATYEPTPAPRGAPQGALELDPSAYPAAPRGGAAVDVHHGVRVADPFRALEDPDAAVTAAFVDAQNAVTEAVLARCPAREAFRGLLTKLYDYEKVSVPSKHGGRYYWSHNSGLQAQYVTYSGAAPYAEDASVLLDPNALSADGTVALTGKAFSECGTLLAYALSSGGSDWREVRFKKVDPATGAAEDLPDVLRHVKFSSLAWTHDGRGLFYNAYAPPGAANGALGTETGANKHQRLMYHALGAPQASDACVLVLPHQPDWMVGAEVSHCGRFLVLSVRAGCEPQNLLWYVDLAGVPADAATGALDFSAYDALARGGAAAPLPLVKLVDEWVGSYEYVASSPDGRVWTLQTNAGAPRGRLVAADLGAAAPPAAWRDVVPEGADLLQWAAPLRGGDLLLCYLAACASSLRLVAADGAPRGELPLPHIGSVGGVWASHKAAEGDEWFFSLTGFAEPGAVYRVEAPAGGAPAGAPPPAPALLRRTALRGLPGFSPDAFTTEQHFFESADGTRVPMFVVSRAGRRRDGTAPTLLYGYGGFNVSLEPTFSVARLAWMLAFDGVFALANIRGGGEFGRGWRDAGSLGNKQNCFDDFCAAAEFLHARGVAAPATTAIQGGSNGGLLVAACANQRPDLFAAVLAQVGVMDLLRFHKFTIGHAWVSDYGDVEQEEAFKWLLPISPVHNVALPAGGGQYPAVMLTTGDHDDRVVPLHSLKLAAALQAAAAAGGPARQRNPLLARVEVRAGHGMGKPTAKVIAESTDMLAFAAAVMGKEFVYAGGA